MEQPIAGLSPKEFVAEIGEIGEITYFVCAYQTKSIVEEGSQGPALLQSSINILQGPVIVSITFIKSPT